MKIDREKINTWCRNLGYIAYMAILLGTLGIFVGGLIAYNVAYSTPEANVIVR
jgi:hypothetical protein